MIDPKEWARQESGWHTHPALGGICYERGHLAGWYWYPVVGERGSYGPFVALWQAKIHAERFAPVGERR
jgi:hypothetical protein